ncbi:dTDP-4-amino-4,6-dideoxygalactose transaminase [Flavobacteriales bacterium]|nr:dTDP-4-amino-4,6-dideoxygalactose transaminase [Flavobacteriales bacterium]
MIPFNRPYITGKETSYLTEAVNKGKISGNGHYTKLCQNYFTQQLGNEQNLCTTSCTDALEMCAILTDIKPGDEVIMPTYTFVSTANAFILRGAKVVFVDSRKDHPGMDEELIKQLITEKTKAIVVVHYAGVACDMDKVVEIAKRHKLIVIEDAAQAIDSYYKGKALGSIGDMGCFSFHETKNIQCGEGGLLSINNAIYKERAEIIWEKGTNRSAFWRGEVDKYNWVDIGSSFLPSELNTSFLFAQLEEIEKIQNKRKQLWEKYYNGLKILEKKNIILSQIPNYATNNAHLFYLICNSLEERTSLIDFLKKEGVMAVFHYICLHDSPYFLDKHDGREMPNAKKYENCLVRLPLWVNMTEGQTSQVITNVLSFFNIKG